MAAEPLAELDGAVLVDLVAEAERLKAALAALQVRATSVLDARAQSECSNREERAAAARSVGGMVALARRESPHTGGRHLGLAREMPHALAALTTGEISEFKATALVRETAVLSREDRTTVDARLANRMGTLGRISDTNAEGLCAACNQRLNHPGWRTTGTSAETTVTTPTDHAYSSRPPPLTGASHHVVHLVGSHGLRLDWLGSSAPAA
ncbi:hypothetical protein GCM10011519_32980 [Marmoricola endophyticus]|uniref:DUF222 domain-containing protein n=2 Tax=Marmoricola endophyticus TaxID=2040280 RepID=A0A917BTP7_9ACTN|nr:hypothetical protein GCM10011519_32980 [Marmoricola endophyticus]